MKHIQKFRANTVSSGKKRFPNVNLQVEALESRWCPSQTTVALIDGHILSITGDDLANTVGIFQNDQANTLDVIDLGGATPRTTSFTSSQIDQIVVDLKGGDDDFRWVLASDTNLTFTKQANILLGDGIDDALIDFRGGGSSGIVGTTRLRANLNITVDAGANDDEVLGHFAGPQGTRLNFTALMGDGDDDVLANLWGPVSSASFDVGGGFSILQKGTVLFDLQGGAGNDEFATVNSFGPDGFGSVNVDFFCNFTIKMDGGIGDDSLGGSEQLLEGGFYHGKIAGSLRFDLNGGAGNDEIHFDLMLKPFSTGAVTFMAQGGADSDNISVALRRDLFGGIDVLFDIDGGADDDTLTTVNSIDVVAGGAVDAIDIGAGSSLTIKTNGGEGRDTINVGYGGHLIDGAALILDVHGGAGNDDVTANVKQGGISNGSLNAVVQGDSDHDVMSFVLAVEPTATLQIINASLQGNDGFDRLRFASPGVVHSGFEVREPKAGGDVLFAPGGMVTGVDQDGDSYTVKLTGPGQVALFLDDADGDGKGPISHIVLQNTNPLTSLLTISVKKAIGGDGIVTIGMIQGSGLKSIKAAASDLVGAGIDLAGPLGSLWLHNVADWSDISAEGVASQRTKITANAIGDNVRVNLGSSISALLANEVGNSAIAASGLDALVVHGDFHADLTLAGGLKSANIAGSIADAVWSIAGDIRTLNVKGHVSDWKLSAASLGAARFSAMEGVIMEVAKAVTSLRTQTFLNSSLAAQSIAQFAATGVAGTPAFANSNVTATTIGKVQLASVETKNGGNTFGITAVESIKAVTVGRPLFKFDKTKPVPQGIDDFQVSIG